MFDSIKQAVPHIVKRAARAVKGIFGPKNGDSSTDKHEWEFRWQQNEWLHLWKKPQTQAKCLEYWMRFRHLDDIRRLIPINGDTRILDVGCGLSSVLHYLPGRCTGVDPLAERYRAIYDYPFDVIKAAGESLPFPDGTFDVVFCSNCVDHTTDPAQTVKEICRVMKPNARFVLTCEVFDADLGARNAGHPHSLTEAKLLALVHGMILISHWTSAWYGMRNYAMDGPPTTQTEHILLLRRP